MQKPQKYKFIHEKHTSVCEGMKSRMNSMYKYATIDSGYKIRYNADNREEIVNERVFL